MARSANHHHLLRAHDAKSGIFTTWCGETQRADWRITSDLKRLNCPKCSSKYYAQRIVMECIPYRLGDRLDLSKDKRRYEFKSIYPVLDMNKQTIAFVAIENGWGRPWSVYSWAAAPLIEMSLNVVPIPRMHYQNVSGTFNSKDEALYNVSAMLAQNKLPSYATIEAKIKIDVEMIRQHWAAKTLKENEKQQKVDMIRENFGQMVNSGTLTNTQTAALIDAAKMLGISL